MKRAMAVWICAVVFAIGILFAVPLGREQAERYSVPLELFQTEDGSYQYDGCAWDSTLEDVMTRLPYTMEEMDVGAKDSVEAADYRYYRSEEMFSLDGQYAVLQMTFVNDRLSEVQFSFELTEGFAAWFDRQAEMLAKLYGTEDARRESAAFKEDDYTHLSYNWFAEDTILQFSLISGPEVEPVAVLGAVRVGHKT